jgi:hypothetical protein
MKPATALAILALALGACSLPSVPEPRALPGEARVKKVERVSWQDPPMPNLYRIEFDAERSKAIRERAPYESPGDRSDTLQAFLQYLEQVAEQELRSRTLCIGTTKIVSTVDGIDGTGPITAVFACRPPVF